MCLCVWGEGDRLKAAAGSASAFNFPPHSPRGVPRMAGGPPTRQGTGNLGGDAEHKEGQKNTTTIILLDGGLDNPVALSPLQIRKQKPRADRSLPEDTQRHTAAGSSSQACLQGWVSRGTFLGMDFKAGDSRGCLVESGWAKNDLSWRARGGQAFRGQTLVPQASSCRRRRGWVEQCLAQPVV